MWENAQTLLLTKGIGESNLSSLNAFDRALQKAKIADYNHSKLSSIIPIGAKLVDSDITQYLPQKGVILPSVWAEMRGLRGDHLISCIAIAQNENPDLPGMLFEISMKNTSVSKVEDKAKKMIEQGFTDRGWRQRKIQLLTSSLIVTKEYGCTLAYIVYV